MYKKLTVLSLALLMLVGCFSKEYTFKLSNDVIFLDQSHEFFTISMLDPYITLLYGESEEPLENASFEGEVDLSKTGVYQITLIAAKKNRKTEFDLEVTVVDKIPPEFYIFEKELLVHKDEDIKVNSNYFFINLVDEFNGLLNDRINVEGSYDLKKVQTYPIELLGTDASGNPATEKINLRVTDIIDEKAQYLYDKATVATHGESFVFNNNDKNDYILNKDSALAVFTPNYREHFYWLSGITGDYNKKQSGVKLRLEDDKMYADFSQQNKVSGYRQTKLEIQYEEENYRHYLATSYYDVDGKEETKKAKFVIRKIDGVWLVEEFYMPY